MYPAWYYPAGLSADLKAQVAAFDAKCDDMVAAGGSLPSPPPMPVPDFVTPKPTVVDKPEEEPDEPEPASDRDDDPDYDPEMDQRERPANDSSKKPAAAKPSRHSAGGAVLRNQTAVVPASKPIKNKSKSRN